MNWTFRAFRLFGIDIRIHWTLLLIWASEVIRWMLAAPRGSSGQYLGYAAALMTGYWISILLHELGHCGAARMRGIAADTVVLWPLGGLAHIGGSGTPRNEIGIAAAGPLVNLLLAGAAFLFIVLNRYALNWSLVDPFGGWGRFEAGWAVALAIDLFRTNLILGLFNLCVPAYPLDGGRILRGLLSYRVGFERATRFCTGLAVGVAVLLGFWGLVQQQIWLVLIAGFILLQAIQERRLLQEGALEGYSQTYLGHDFSMGYTSLERGGPEPERKRRRPGFFARYRQRRAERRARRLQEEEARLRERVDQLLDKVSREGLAALSPEERRSLEQASRRFQEFEAQRKG